MTYDEAIKAAFFNELKKIAASNQMLAASSKLRSGRRPMSAETMLAKDKAGELYKSASTPMRRRLERMAERRGTTVEELMSSKTAFGSDQASLFYSDSDPKTGAPARAKGKRGDVPSREDTISPAKTVDRQTVTTTTAPGLLDTDSNNRPSERAY